MSVDPKKEGWPEAGTTAQLATVPGAEIAHPVMNDTDVTMVLTTLAMYAVPSTMVSPCGVLSWKPLAGAASAAHEVMVGGTVAETWHAVMSFVNEFVM